jgi:hypothetical protein
LPEYKKTTQQTATHGYQRSGGDDDEVVQMIDCLLKVQM